DDQVRIAALAGVVTASVWIRSVLVIALDDGAGRNRHRNDVALAGIVVDADPDPGRAVSMDNIHRNAVQRTGPVAGTIFAPIGMVFDGAANMRDDGRRVGRHRRG